MVGADVPTDGDVMTGAGATGKDKTSQVIPQVRSRGWALFSATGWFILAATGGVQAAITHDLVARWLGVAACVAGLWLGSVYVVAARRAPKPRRRSDAAK
jgi:hypothetical protein